MNSLIKMVKNEYIKLVFSKGMLIFTLFLIIYNYEINGIVSSNNANLMQIIYNSFDNIGFLSVMIIFKSVESIAIDFSTGAINQILTKSISRLKYFISKLVFIVSLIIVSITINTIIVIIINIIETSNLKLGIGEFLIKGDMTYSVDIMYAVIVNLFSTIFDNIFLASLALTTVIFTLEKTLSIVITLCLWIFGAIASVLYKSSFMTNVFFSYHFNFVKLLESNKDYSNSAAINSFFVLLIYIIIFYLASGIRIIKKDIFTS